jgi:hypothetical protein
MPDPIVVIASTSDPLTKRIAVPLNELAREKIYS